MPRTKDTRNFRGSILEKEVIKNGRKAIAFDVRVRVAKIDNAGEPIVNAKGQKLYKDKTKRYWTKTEANVALINLINEVDKIPKVKEPPKKTFLDLATYYRAEYAKPAVIVNGKKKAGFKSNLATVKRHITELEEHFGAMPIELINYEDLRILTEKCFLTPTAKETLPAVTTVNEKLSRLRKMFTVAIQKGWIKVNPFTLGDTLIDRAAENRRNRMMTFEEEAYLHAACQPHKMKFHQERTLKTGKVTKYTVRRWVDRRHLIPIMVAAVDTALRAGEVFNLEPWQTDFDENVIYLTKEAAEKTKTGKAGIVPMTSRLRAILLDIKDRTPWGKNMKIFPEFNYDRSFKSACEEAGIEDLQFRDLRSTGATRMVLSGGATSQVMKITRHSPESIKVFLEHYTNVDVQNARVIGGSLDKFMEIEQAKVKAKVKVEKGDFSKAA
ncbi:MAG: tyrosine-type recombinase/integrase [Pyrinomonadaceae bacterium]